MRNATVQIPIGMTADADAVVPWLTKHNLQFGECLDFGEGDLRWLMVCSCGWEGFDRLLSNVQRTYEAHAGLARVGPVYIGKFTREI